jgi:hypothetical protein
MLRGVCVLPLPRTEGRRSGVGGRGSGVGVWGEAQCASERVEDLYNSVPYRTQLFLLLVVPLARVRPTSELTHRRVGIRDSTDVPFKVVPRSAAGAEIPGDRRPVGERERETVGGRG